MSVVRSATNMASSRRRLRFNKSQLLDLIRSRPRQCIRSASDSSASAGDGDKANSKTMKLLAMTKFTRESRQISDQPRGILFQEQERKKQLTRMPKGLQMMGLESGQKVTYFFCDSHGTSAYRCTCLDRGVCVVGSQKAFEHRNLCRNVGKFQASISVQAMTDCASRRLIRYVRAVLKPLCKLHSEGTGDL